MNFEKKKSLASRALGVGRGRVVFNTSRLDEVKEAITKQDIRDLVAAGAISIKEIKGTRKSIKRKTRRRAGSIKLRIKNSKTKYMVLTRKLRSYLQEMRKQNKISNEIFTKLRKEIKAHSFKSKSHMKERIAIIGVK